MSFIKIFFKVLLHRLCDSYVLGFFVLTQIRSWKILELSSMGTSFSYPYHTFPFKYFCPLQQCLQNSLYQQTFAK